MIKGLEFGVREAGIQPHHRSRTITPLGQIPAVKSGQQTAVQAYIAGDIAPRSKAETRKEAVSSTLSDYLDSRIPSLPSLGAASQLQTRLRSSASLPFSAQNFLSGFSQKSHLPTPTTGSSSVVQQRTFCTSAKRFQQPSSAGPGGARPKLPGRNWIAASQPSSSFLRATTSVCDCTILRIRNRLIQANRFRLRRRLLRQVCTSTT